MSPQLAATHIMPTDIRKAISEAVDRLTRAREVPRVETQPVHSAPRRRFVLSRRSKQKMMTLLRHASNAASGRPARGNSIETVWTWLQQLGFAGNASGLLDALTKEFVRLPIDQAAAAPAGSVIVLSGTAAVKGFGQKYYADGELAALPQDVLGVYAPK